MQICFIRDSVSLVMPVTPGSYKWANGKNMETINISQLGDVYRPGGRARFSGSFDFLLPAQEYPWMESGARADPQYYLDYLNAWALDDKTVRHGHHRHGDQLPGVYRGGLPRGAGRHWRPLCHRAIRGI